MNIKKEIEKLSREELLALMNLSGLYIFVRPESIREAKWRCLARRAGRMMDEAMAEMRANTGLENNKKYFAANVKFERGLAMHEKALKMREQGVAR